MSDRNVTKSDSINSEDKEKEEYHQEIRQRILLIKKKIES